MLVHLGAIFSGTLFVLAIVAGIGPQNLNTLSHAIKRNHEYAVATTCFLADSIPLVLGCIGVNLAHRSIIMLINWVGIIFMSWYLLYKIYSVFRSHKAYKIDSNFLSLKMAILRALALTWLNPLVFIDTIVIIGGTAAQYKGAAWVNFLIGAILGDFIWLYGLTTVGRQLSHKLNRISIWVSLDIMTIIIMLVILYRTVKFVIL